MGVTAHPEFAALVPRRLLTAVVVLVVGVGCLLAFLAAGGSALEDTSWSLVSWSASSPDPQDFTITAAFADGRISGTAAVNSYSGECAVGGIKFSTGALARTEMAGPPEAMEAESTYFELLARAETYEADGDRLALIDASGTAVLVFERIR